MKKQYIKPFYPVSRPSLSGNELKYVTDAVKTGWISSLGKYVSRLEQDFADYCGAKHGVAVSNGTVSLHLIMAASGIGQGDEVIMPDLSFIACANAVLMAGATPVFCDIDPVTLCIDPLSAEAAVTSRTKAIMPVHLYGHPAAMGEVMAIAQKHSLLVIEDSAEAHGAKLDGRRVGGLGHCASFSFFANKNMTTGEGGMITTNDAQLAARCRKLRDHGMTPDRRYWHEEPGYNYRMTNLQAALGCAQFEQLDGFLLARKALFDGYSARLGTLRGISLNRTKANAANAYWMICMEIDGISRKERDSLIERLKADGVDTRPYFYPMSMMPYFEEADTPVSHDVSARGLNLPSAATYTDDDVNYICEVIKLHLREGW